jgi:hypothetical protein
MQGGQDAVWRSTLLISSTLSPTYQAQASDPTVVPAAKPCAEGPRATRSLVCSAIGPIGVVRARPLTVSLDSTDNLSGEFAKVSSR